jgi:hypothetical protein
MSGVTISATRSWSRWLRTRVCVLRRAATRSPYCAQINLYVGTSKVLAPVVTPADSDVASAGRRAARMSWLNSRSLRVGGRCPALAGHGSTSYRRPCGRSAAAISWIRLPGGTEGIPGGSSRHLVDVAASVSPHRCHRIDVVWSAYLMDTAWPMRYPRVLIKISEVSLSFCPLTE